MESNKLQIRKKLRIPGYDYTTQGAYFITICCKNKEKLFGQIEIHKNAKVKLNKNGLIVEKHVNKIPEILKYIIMPNHVHMLLLLSDESKENGKSIPKIMRSFKSEVTKEVGFPCWQRSYHDRVVRNENELAMIWNYIENNAETWNQDCYYK